MCKIKSAVIIDNCIVNNFLNSKILETYGITNLISFSNAHNALDYLKETNFKYELILVDIYMPVMDGFEFIDKFYDLKLNKKQGNLFILSTTMDPCHAEKSKSKKIKIIEKPLTIEKILMNVSTI
jgi:CheY-like chemotaxis protein